MPRRGEVVLLKIKVKEKAYSEVAAMTPRMHMRPVKQSALLRHTVSTLSEAELASVGFKCDTNGMERLGADEPALFLMNHSCFTDLEIAFRLLANRQYHIVCTNDGLIGKAGLFSRVGCIPAKKFISDMYLIKDMKYAVDELNSSILMYPEASYSFDGTTTPLPDSIGKFIKMLRIPVVMIRTKGAFLRDPLYNCLQKRKVKVTATETYLLSQEDIAHKSADEINAVIQGAFEYDHFKEQYENGVIVDEPFRADGLHRVLYRCPVCQTEGEMHGEGIYITCRHCGSRWELNENGKLERQYEDTDGDGTVDAELDSVDIRRGVPVNDAVKKFEFVPEWYAWERECVRREIRAGEYVMDMDVEIYMMVDFDSLYHVGCGRLIHDGDGFTLTGCNGELDYQQSPKHSYSLYADYYWYELGDMIGIGDAQKQFYCIPKDQDGAIVAKARLAAEEMYKLNS